MSGGKFNYDQYRISHIAEEIKHLIESNDDTSLNEWGDPRGLGYPPEVIEKFKEGYQALCVAFVYAQRIDWLVSGDDGEDSFLKRLEEDIDKIVDKQISTGL